jgi:predicted metalloprotease
MRWETGRRSENVEDRRGMGRGVAVGGGVATIVLAVVVALMGGDPTSLFTTSEPSRSALAPETEKRLQDFSSVVLAETEDVWTDLFAKTGRRYQAPRMVLFTGRVESACGLADAAVGPFYCPGDSKLYLDLAFFADLAERFHAPGDFAQAYVIAHEVGHHVQHLLGTTDRVDRARAGETKTQANALSVRLELQADFYAGVWAHHAQRMFSMLEEGDVEEALGAASAVGDDRLQREAAGRVVPDSFTHGTSKQRAAWFLRGFKSGDMSQGDTFDDAVYSSVGK